LDAEEKYCEDGGRWNRVTAVSNIQLIIQVRLPLWSSGQSSWLQIQRCRFESRH
jgi:hypothetical protein